jgi:hypothetical protein
MNRRQFIGTLSAAALATCAGGGAPGGPAGAGVRAGVLEHHGGPRRDGVYVDPALAPAAAAGLRLDPSFQAAMDGPIYAQPLYVPGAGGPDLVVAASEQNEVAAFDDDSIRAVNRQPNDGWIRSRTHDEVVFQLSLISVVNQVHTRIHGLVAYFRKLPDVGVPSRGIASSKVVACSR